MLIGSDSDYKGVKPKYFDFCYWLFKEFFHFKCEKMIIGKYTFLFGNLEWLCSICSIITCGSNYILISWSSIVLCSSLQKNKTKPSPIIRELIDSLHSNNTHSKNRLFLGPNSPIFPNLENSRIAQRHPFARWEDNCLQHRGIDQIWSG